MNWLGMLLAGVVAVTASACTTATGDGTGEYSAEDAVNDYGGYICDLLAQGETLASVKLRMADTGEVDIAEADAIVNASVERHCPNYDSAIYPGFNNGQDYAPTFGGGDSAPNTAPAPAPSHQPRRLSCSDIWQDVAVTYEMRDDAHSWDPKGSQKLYPRVTVVNRSKRNATVSIFGRGRTTSKYTPDLPLKMSWNKRFPVKAGISSTVDVGPNIGATLFVSEGETYEILMMGVDLNVEGGPSHPCHRNL